jgi:hypothetical protein
MKIRVSRECIKDGQKDDMCYCPIGLAIRRRHGFTDVRVDRQAIYFVRGEQEYVRVLPHDAQQFILRFDAGHRVEPFTFDLEL